MKYFVNAFRDFSFKGRVSRKEFWIFSGLYSVFELIVYFLLYLFLYSVAPEENPLIHDLIPCILGFMLMFVPLSMQIKRLHDIGKSGNNVFWGALPVIGTVILIVYYVRKGDPVANAYGAPPVVTKKAEPIYTSVDDQMQVDLDKVEFSIPVVLKTENPAAEPKKRSYKVLSIVLSVLLVVSVGANIALFTTTSNLSSQLSLTESQIEAFELGTTRNNGATSNFQVYVCSGQDLFHYSPACTAILASECYPMSLKTADAAGRRYCHICFTGVDRLRVVLYTEE